MLAEELKRQQFSDEDLESLGFDQSELHELMREKLSTTYKDWTPGSLAADYGVPPFSVLDARQGYWRARKAWWREKMQGFEAKTRHKALTGGGVYADVSTASILDAFLCELLCLWFARPGYKVLNPFAGGAQFGFVAASMGLEYTGIELRQEQVDANTALFHKAGLEANYICGDALNVLEYCEHESQDMLFSCPPYGDLEHYGDDERDLANMTHAKYLKQLDEVLRRACETLKPNRFACLVLGECRGKGGGMIGLVPHAIKSMQRAGLHFWNDLVLVTAGANIALRVRKPFEANRKIQHCHQYVLIFYKGDEKAIREEFAGPLAQASE